MQYRFEIDFLSKFENKNDESNIRKIVSEPEIEILKKNHQNLPLEYINYLREIGTGSFRECQFNVSEYLFNLRDIGLSEFYPIKKEILFFGDNFSGDFTGFDFEKKSQFVIEFWHEDGTIYETNKTFKQYIREQMLIGENGNDMRIK